ncbi:DNA repair protein XRCC3-like isoform X2 [Venturia canescens]|uniref:DNA repair protein XRCC3-like isoform X2 n=1 Tax=Venturia canescens TaxID=32260 RepID=UPI001C9CFA9C|nr:DNA repair protein XRCC3-like isoform X2 [Venturia canescens]
MEFWTSADERLEKEKYLTTGCYKLDAALRGGISQKGITQIYGAAGTGKTQYALQLCLSVQTSKTNGGCEAGAAYICTESAFPTRRLQQLLKSSELVTKHGASADKIFVEHVSTITDLESCIFDRIPGLLKAQKVSVLVIDSIAAPYRAEYNDQELKNRAKSLRSIGQCLHNLSRDYELSVVCINQVTSAVDNKNSSNVCGGDLPTLGITWANLVTNSLCLVKNGDRRYLHVRESPYLSRTTIPYEIHQSGVRGI